jgi:chemotaxis protein MotB
MKRIAKVLIFVVIGSSFMMNSCIVTKKKYDEAVANGKKSLDSLNKVFDNTVAGFNNSTNTLKINNTSKDLTVDSLNKENQKLAGDKATLNQSLINTINDYKAEQAKLSQKTRTADSLMNILTLKASQEDSVRNLNQSQVNELNSMLLTIQKQLNGVNQSEAYAQIVGSNVVVTFSNDYLFKAATSNEISVKGAATLKKVSAVFTLFDQCRVHVISNTDNNGQSKTLLELSAKRAAAVVTTIASNCTLPGTAYTASGRGMYSPLVANNSDANKKKNRRTDLIIIMN